MSTNIDNNEDGSSILYLLAAISQAEIEELGVNNTLLDEIRETRTRSALHGRLKGPFVHLKGFASGMTVGENVKDAVINFLQSQGANTVVWDGDDWAEDSFTVVLPWIKEKLPHIQIVAFLMERHRHFRSGQEGGFHGSWQGRLPGQTIVVLVDDSIAASGRYERLGMLALQTTMAQTVLTLGGGAVLVTEFEQRASGVVYYLLNVSRHLRGNTDHSALVGREHVQLIQY